MKFMFAYIATIVLTNFGFAYIHPIDIGFGLFSPMALVAGAVFVVRDYAQRAVGHYVLFGMIAGCAISYVMADPFVAIASAASFAVSELVDWGTYTITKRPFYQRILISSLIATPIDTAVFLAFINILTPATFVLMVAAKLVTAFAMFYYGKLREQDLATA